MRKIILLITIITACAASIPADARKTRVEPSYAWKLIPPLGLREPATIDTSFVNYARESVPSEVASPAYATTGNFGAEGLNMIFFEREPISDFFSLTRSAPICRASAR